MSELWKNTIDNIDEKYLDEAAEAISKGFRDSEPYTDEHSPKVMKIEQPKKHFSKGLIAGISAAAVAVAAIGVGVFFIKNRPSDLTNSTSENSIAAITEKFNPEDYSRFCVENTSIGYSMELDEYKTNRLKELFSGGDSKLLSDITDIAANVKPSMGRIVAETDSGEKITLSPAVSYQGYYYMMESEDSRAYFEISNEFYDELTIFIENYAPDVIYSEIAVVEGGGSYIVDDIRIHSDYDLQVGDLVKIYYYGGIMETYPAQIHMLELVPLYNPHNDDTAVWSSTADTMDWDIWAERFAANWHNKADNEQFSWTLNRDGFETLSDEPVPTACYQDDKGWYFRAEAKGKICGYFISKDYPERMYFYQPSDSAALFSDYFGVYTRTGSSDNYDKEEMLAPHGRLSPTGFRRLCDIMGEGFTEFIYGADEKGYTASNGQTWYGFSGLPYNGREGAFLNAYGNRYAELAVKLYSAEDFPMLNSTNIDESSEPQMLMLYINCGEEGEWFIEKMRKCDSNGNVLATNSLSYSVMGARHIQMTYDLTDEGDSMLVTDLDVRLVADYDDSLVEKLQFPYEEFGSSDNTLRLPKTDTFKGAILTGDARGTDSVIIRDGYIACFYVPYLEGGEVRFKGVFYLADSKSAYLCNDIISGMSCRNIVPITTADNAVALYLLDDSAPAVYSVDFENRRLTPFDTTAPFSDSTEAITLDYSRANPDNKISPITTEGYSTYISRFYGVWGDKNGRIDLTVSTDKDIFSLDNPCRGFYSDDSGYYMLGGTEVWFIPKKNTDTMLYFSNVSDGDTLKLSECDKVYQQLVNINGIGFTNLYAGLGYFGEIDVAFTFGTTHEALYNITYTDDNGTVWERTPDMSVDWGEIRRTSLVTDDNLSHIVYHIPLRNRATPSEFKEFAFTPPVMNADMENLSDSFSGVCLGSYNSDICDLSKVASDTSNRSVQENSADIMPYGFFTTKVTIYALEGGRFYASREMGNNMSQWLPDRDFWYYDGTEYHLLAEGFGGCEVINGRLYVYIDNEIMVFDGETHIKTTELLHTFSGMVGAPQLHYDRYFVFTASWSIYEETPFEIYDTVTNKVLTVDSLTYPVHTADPIVAVKDGVTYTCDSEIDTIQVLFD